MKKINGMTLIELLIVVAIIAILASVATVIYSSQARNSRRADALNTIISISLAEEQYRSSNSQYGTLAQVWGGVTTSAEGYYTIAITNVSATGYTITVTGVGNQANDSINGVACSPLTYTVSNGTVTKSPATCWPT